MSVSSISRPPYNCAVGDLVVLDLQPLEDLLRRASLNNHGGREALLANSEATELPLHHIAAGQVFVGERQGAIVGIAVVSPRVDGAPELDALFVQPEASLASNEPRSSTVRTSPRGDGQPCMPHSEGFCRACGFVHFRTKRARFRVGQLL